MREFRRIHKEKLESMLELFCGTQDRILDTRERHLALQLSPYDGAFCQVDNAHSHSV